MLAIIEIQPLTTSGLTLPWAPLDYEVATKCMKKALESGANLWNGVSLHKSSIYDVTSNTAV